METKTACELVWMHLLQNQSVHGSGPNATLQVNAYQSISRKSEFDAALAISQDEPIVVFKHSRMCELSAMAWQKMQSVQIPVYEVVVQSARPLSNHIEQFLGVRHETPQVIVLIRGQPVFDASHRRVTAKAVHQAAGLAQPSS